MNNIIRELEHIVEKYYLDQETALSFGTSIPPFVEVSIIDLDYIIKRYKSTSNALYNLYNKLDVYEVGRVVTIYGPDDPERLKGSLVYRCTLTNGEIEQIEKLLEKYKAMS